MKPSRLLVHIALFTLPAAVLGAEQGLFYTPAERARVTAERIDMLAREARAGAPTEASIAPAASGAPGDPATAESPDSIAGPPRLAGVSLNHAGRAYAWIGGRRYQDGDLINGQRLRVLRNGVQLVGANGPGRLHRIGEAIQGAARE